MHLTLDAVCEGRCPDLDLVVFSSPVRIHYSEHEAHGDGWYEPYEAAHATFDFATVDGVRLAPGPLLTWAEQWFELQGIEFSPAIMDPDEARDRAFDRALDAAA